MKKVLTILAVMGFMFAVLTTPLHASETEVIDEVNTEEVVDEELTYEQEVDEFMNELNMTLAQVFAWIGGFSGLTGLAIFLMRFIKDKNIMKQIRDEIAASRQDASNTNSKMMMVEKALNTYAKREEMMEKMFINMITASNMDPKMKQHIIEGLKNDEFSVQDVMESGINLAKDEAENQTMLKEQINQTTQSLLSKLFEQE